MIMALLDDVPSEGGSTDPARRKHACVHPTLPTQETGHSAWHMIGGSGALASSTRRGRSSFALGEPASPQRVLSGPLPPLLPISQPFRLESASAATGREAEVSCAAKERQTRASGGGRFDVYINGTTPGAPYLTSLTGIRGSLLSAGSRPPCALLGFGRCCGGRLLADANFLSGTQCPESRQPQDTSSSHSVVTDPACLEDRCRGNIRADAK
jgi:hypothetical protein